MNPKWLLPIGLVLGLGLLGVAGATKPLQRVQLWLDQRSVHCCRPWLRVTRCWLSSSTKPMYSPTPQTKNSTMPSALQRGWRVVHGVW